MGMTIFIYDRYNRYINIIIDHHYQYQPIDQYNRYIMQARIRLFNFNDQIIDEKARKLFNVYTSVFCTKKYMYVYIFLYCILSILHIQFSLSILCKYNYTMNTRQM